MGKCDKYWEKRLKLLEVIKKDEGKSPISVTCKGILSTGASLTSVTNDMEEQGFIIKSKQSNNVVKTYITPKGERLIAILRELKRVVGK